RNWKKSNPKSPRWNRNSTIPPLRRKFHPPFWKSTNSVLLNGKANALIQKLRSTRCRVKLPDENFFSEQSPGCRRESRARRRKDHARQLATAKAGQSCRCARHQARIGRPLPTRHRENFVRRVSRNFRRR